MVRYLLRLTLLVALLVLLLPARPVAAAAPAIGDVIFNEYRSTDDANFNEFFELLIIGDSVDLRGVRVSDNELADENGTLNTGEAVFIFNDEPYLASLPAGTIVTVWIKLDGVTPDTTLDPLNDDWALVLTHDAGINNALTDGLGGSRVVGLDTNDALYLYLPGADMDSTGSNDYLDFILWNNAVAAKPAALGGLSLAGTATNAYFTGSSLSAKNDGANWVTSDASGVANATPGAANPGQDLSALRDPNAIELLSFDAQPIAAHSVQLTWETASEIDLAAFNIARGQSADGHDAIIVNPLPLAASGQNGLGARYNWLESNVPAGDWHYFLHAVDGSGQSVAHGPVGVTLGTPLHVTLQSAARVADARHFGALLGILAALIMLQCAAFVTRQK